MLLYGGRGGSLALRSGEEEQAYLEFVRTVTAQIDYVVRFKTPVDQENMAKPENGLKLEFEPLSLFEADLSTTASSGANEKEYARLFLASKKWRKR